MLAAELDDQMTIEDFLNYEQMKIGGLSLTIQGIDLV